MVEKGSILLLHSGQYCSIVEETDIEGIRIAFSPHVFDNMTRNIANVVKYTLFRNFNIIRIESRDFHEYIEECFSMLLVESKTNIHSFMYNPRLYSMLYYTITKIYEYQPNVNNGNGVTSKTLELFIRFSAMIDDRYKTMRSVTEYRTALNVSHKLLTECAREHANKSPLDMIMEKTVFEAKKLLNYTNLSIKEIALELGYREPSNFSTLFKKHTKVSPNQYRERNSNKLSSDAQKY